MHRFSIRTRLIISLSLILFVAFFATSMVNYKLSRDSVRSEIINKSLPLTRDTIYSEIQADLIRPIYVSSLMAHDTFLKDWALEGEKDTRKIIDYLREIKLKYGFFSSFFVSQKTGKYYYYGGILKTLSLDDPHDIWYYDFLDLGREYDLDVDTNQAADDLLTIFINHRVTSPAGGLLGVVGVGLRMERVAEKFESYLGRFGCNVFLVDPSGLMQVNTDSSLIQHADISTMPGISGVAGEILTCRDDGCKDLQYDLEGGHMLLTVRYIPEFDWFLVLEQDETASMATVRSNLWRTLSVGLAATLLIIALTVITVNIFQGKLERMAATDELTGAANRREFEYLFQKAAARPEAGAGRPSVIIMDIDDFKNLNDTFGHVEGDRVLRALAQCARSSIRREDHLVRWGGDEFLILAQGDEKLAREMAWRVTEAIKAAVHGGDVTSFAVSCGIASFYRGDTMDDLVARADKAMYRTKRETKNSPA